MGHKHHHSVEKGNGHIVGLAAIFVGVVFVLEQVGFWNLIGVGAPQGLMFQGLLFLAFYFLIKNFLFTPMTKIFIERTKLTTDKKKEIEGLENESKALFEKYTLAIEEAKLKALREKEKMGLEAEKHEKEKIAQAKGQAENQMNQIKKTLEVEAATTRGELEKNVKTISEEITRMIRGDSSLSTTEHSNQKSAQV